MTTSADDLASLLMREHETGLPFVNHMRDRGIADMAGAYAVQSALVRKLTERFGGPVGYKVALTSKRMQEMCGIDQPLSGHVLARRVHEGGAVIPLSAFGHVGIEFEIAMKLARALGPRSEPYGFDEIAASVGAVCPSFELVDDRKADYKILDVYSLIADNAWNGGAVLGAFRERWPDLGAVAGTVERNGETIDSGHGRDVLGHPFNSLMWLANHLSARGIALREGDIVMTGSLVTTRFPGAGETYRFTVQDIGSVEVSFTA